MGRVEILIRSHKKGITRANETLASRFSLLAFLCLCVAAPVSASTLYDNGPVTPGDASYSAAYIYFGYVVSDSFTLGSTSTLTGAQVGLWENAGGYVPVSVDWKLGSAPGASDLGSGTSLFTTNTFEFSAGPYDVYKSNFAITGSLSAGSYWFSLTNAFDTGFTAGNGGMYWDVNNGPSAAWDSSGKPPGWCHSGDPSLSCSNSFQIYGNARSTATPEPSSLLLLGSGLLGLGGYVRRRFAR